MLDLLCCNLLLISTCNYRCYYCMGDRTEPANAEPGLLDLENLSKIYEKLKAASNYVLTSFHCKGGEPSLHPQIVEILDLATNAGGAHVLTNMSAPIEKWMPSQPERICLLATLHPEAEKNRSAFLRRLGAARSAGFVTAAQFVAHPSRTPDAGKLSRAFRRGGFRFTFSSFNGTFEGKKYPASYTGDELTAFKLPKSTVYEHSPTRLKKGRKRTCSAGWNSVWIREGTKLCRCRKYFKKPELKTLAKGPSPCSRKCWLAHGIKDPGTLSPETLKISRLLRGTR